MSIADDDPNRLKGSSCTATLDYATRTLTFEHRGHEPWKGGVASDPTSIALSTRRRSHSECSK
jgi:hypothetical protein